MRLFIYGSYAIASDHAVFPAAIIKWDYDRKNAQRLGYILNKKALRANLKP